MSPLPLWAQLSSELRSRLARGEFAERFPTDEELQEAYKVSRQTVREAVRHLTQDGLVVRQRGRGSSVVPPIIEQPLHSLYSLASTARSQGVDERSDVLAFEVRPASPEVATKLEIPPNKEVTFIERLRFAGNEPMAWDRSWLCNDLTSHLLASELSSGSLYELLSARYSLRITDGWERIRPVIPDEAERTLLRLPTGLAAFSIERKALVDQRPVEWRLSLIRGDRYSFIAQWPGGSSPQPKR
jgi:GntR family transcriptional regulator